MIGVGINENVILLKAEINDKGRLTLTFKQVSDKVKSAFEQLESASGQIEMEVDTISLQLLSLNIPKDTDKFKWTTENRLARINGDITNLRNKLTHILEVYMTSDKIKWTTFAGINMTAENYEEQIVQQPILDVIYKNLAEQFIDMIKPVVGVDQPELRMRLKLVRQSEEKHYATLPSSNFPYTKEPFIEPMLVPKENSNVKFSAWEIKNKLDNAAPVAKESADENTSAAPAVQGALFGSR